MELFRIGSDAVWLKFTSDYCRNINSNDESRFQIVDEYYSKHGSVPTRGEHISDAVRKINTASNSIIIV
jgi:hypothetical protein